MMGKAQRAHHVENALLIGKVRSDTRKIEHAKLTYQITTLQTMGTQALLILRSESIRTFIIDTTPGK